MPWKEYDTQERAVMSFAHDDTATDQVVDDPHGTEREWWDGSPSTDRQQAGGGPTSRHTAAVTLRRRAGRGTMAS